MKEDPNGANYSTDYRYDALDHLRLVSQGYCPACQGRTFSYDTLGRLTSASNPESGTVQYTYDSVGNRQTRVDARGIITSYTYDALDRLQTVAYSDGTPSVTYAYDAPGQSYGKGRLANVANANSVTNFTSFDALGRVLASNQVTLGQSYNFAYTYNRAGALTSETYPSGRVVSTAYDGANRVAAVTGTRGGAATPYLSHLSYAPHGALTKSWYANGLAHTGYLFTGRLQPRYIWDAFGDDPNRFVFWQGLDWGGAGANNGTLYARDTRQGGPDQWGNLTGFVQSFAYDQLNRLTAASENNSTTWSRTFSYDQYGNMWISNATGMTPAGNAPTTNLFNGRNQMAGVSYDGAGNQLGANGNVLAYNAENRLSSVTDNLSNVSETLLYDGLGQRVAKQNTSFGRPLNGPTVYVYDAFGRTAAEYAGTPFSTPVCATCYLSYDHLGSVRLVTDGNGQVVSRHDFLPLGEEIPAGQAGRSPQFSADDQLGPKFTGQERDAELGLDYFQARYYGAAFGRFTSPDPANAGADLSNPQSWNSYAYAMNNPLTNTDPTGLDTITQPLPLPVSCPACYVTVNGGTSPDVPGYPGCVSYGTQGCILQPVTLGGSGPGGGGGSTGSVTFTATGLGKADIATASTPPAQPLQPPAPPNNDPTKRKAACTVDALVTFGFSTFVPGYAAVKTLAGAFDVSFNPVEAYYGYKPILSAGPTVPSAAAGASSAYWGYKTWVFAAAGGQGQLDRLNDLASRTFSGAANAAKYGPEIKYLNGLRGAATFAGRLTGVLNGLSLANDVYGCLGVN